MALEDDAEVMSNTALAEQITGQPAEVEAEVLAINDEARNRSLQVALLVPAPRMPARPRQLLPDAALPTKPRPDEGWARAEPPPAAVAAGTTPAGQRPSA